MADFDSYNEDITRFYELMAVLEDGLGGKRLLGECTGKQAWPRRGVYFIFEDGETRADDLEALRVTRVGTHAIREGQETTLWARLRNHRGTKTGGGYQRSSVFRRHVGLALMNRFQDTIEIPSWKNYNPTKEERQREWELERLVSNYIGKTRLLWLSIEDAPSPISDRAYIEKQAIALLSNPLNRDRPTSGWLGNYSPRNEIKSSGLWNVDHVSVNYEPKFLDVFEKYVKKSI
ncbi:MAG: hypothetical protein HPY73_03220 [Methanomassiliicoccales archaeon]|nr:MAG: hypothetical protein HPY73_03180 [Methanomassiliicoccales archaeon]QLH74555.1 MAG: hypothetical protein HPY73_03220 [Methanomassiliicoccales archaeon]